MRTLPLFVILLICACMYGAIAGELSDSLIFGDPAAETAHSVQGDGFNETISALIGMVNESTLCRTSQPVLNSSFQLTLHKQPGQAFTLQIQEVYPPESSGVRYSYQIDIDGTVVYVRDYIGTMCGTVSYFVNVDNPQLLPASEIILRFTNTRDGSPFRVSAVWLFSDFNAYCQSSNFNVPFYMTPLLKQYSVESQLQNEFIYLKNNVAPIVNPDVRLGCSQEHYYMHKSAAQSQQQFQWLLKYAKMYDMPYTPLFVSWWGGTPLNISDGLGGKFGDPKYQQVCWSQSDNYDEGSTLKTLLGSKWDLRYGWTVPNIWSNTPWLTMNSSVLNNARAKAIGDKLTTLRSVLVDPNYSGCGDYLLGITMENEPRYWDYRCPDSAYPVTRQNLWGDFNPLTVADAAEDGVVLDPSDGLSYSERMWLHTNVANYQQETYNAHAAAMKKLRMPFINSSIDSLWHEVYSHAFPSPVFPMDQLNAYHPGLEWNRLQGCRPGLEDVGSSAVRYLEKTREWGRWSQVNYEETNIADTNAHLSALRVCYAFGARFYNFYNWQNLDANGVWLPYVRAFCGDLSCYMLTQESPQAGATYAAATSCSFSITLPASAAYLNELDLTLDTAGEYVLQIKEANSQNRLFAYRRKSVSSAGLVRFDVPNCVPLDTWKNLNITLSRTDGQQFGILTNPSGKRVWVAYADSARERMQSLMISWRADAQALIADLKAKGLSGLEIADQLLAVGDYRRAYEEASRVEITTPAMLWEVQVSYSSNPTVDKPSARAIAVDPRNGNIYVQCTASSTTGTIRKYDANGNLLMTIGPSVKNSSGSTVFTLGNGQPWGLAVDPLSGYLYVANNGTHYVVNASASPAVYVRTVDDGVYGFDANTAFSDNGQKYYITGLIQSSGSVRGVRELTRRDAGTPTNYNDDYFDKDYGYLNYISRGVMPTAAYADPRGVAVDRNGRIYVTDLDESVKHPVRRYSPGLTIWPDLEFYVPASKQWACDTDAQNNLWLADIPTDANDQMVHHYVRCFCQGKEIVSFDPTVGHIVEPDVVACDRKNGRVLVLGKSAVGDANAIYLQSWSVGPNAVPTGKLAGRVTDAVTQAVVPTRWVIIRPAYTDIHPDFHMTFYNTVTAAGLFSCDLPVGLYNVSSSYTNYLTSEVSHNRVDMGVETTVPDIPLLSIHSDYVSIKLGDHNIGQGLFMRPTTPLTNIDEQLGGSASFVDNVGGVNCRGFGRVGNGQDERYMDFDVEDAFISSTAPGTPVWIEADLYDAGFDRWSACMDTHASPVTNLGVFIKGNSQAWKTTRLARKDARFGGGIAGSAGPADIRLDSLPVDGSLPAGVDYVSKLTVRKSAGATSYESVPSIGDAKKMATNPDGLAVTVESKVVTWVGTGEFYIEEPDRSSGIRILCTDAPPAVGSSVTMDGVLTSLAGTGELAVSAWAVRPGGTAVTVAPLGVIGRLAAGGPVCKTYDAEGTTYSIMTQPGVSAVGESNVGLLVRVWGTVISAGGSGAASFAYIDDGSHISGEADSIGIKLIGSQAMGLQVGQYITANGIASMGLYDPSPTDPANGNERRYPIILLTDPVQPVAGQP